MSEQPRTTFKFLGLLFLSSVSSSFSYCQQIAISSIEHDAMEALIDFAYTGKVTICQSNVQSLLVGASYLNLKVWLLISNEQIFL